ncbi:MAG: DUF4347 domain-containing protein, partial [Pseudomonadota bacterium]
MYPVKLFALAKHLRKARPFRQPENSVSLLALEQRYLLDAAGAATGTEVITENIASEQLDLAIASLNETRGLASAERDADAPVKPVSAFDRDAYRTTNEDGETATQVVFIDGSISNAQDLLSGIDPNADVYFIDPNSDGVEQIADILSRYDNLDAVHILSHGDQGVLRLGNTELTATSMVGEHADELAAIGAALSVDGDILIYGCDFSGGEDGLEAAMILGGLTGADIAASTDDTGAAALGGDWDLETNVGSVETESIQARAFAGLLASPQIDLNFRDGDANLDRAFAARINTFALAFGPTVEITDGDGSTLESATITLTNGPLLRFEVFIADLPAGITVQSTSASEIVLTGTASLEDYALALDKVRVASSNARTVTVSVVVNDGTMDSNVATSTITFVGGAAPTVNDEGNSIQVVEAGSGITQPSVTGNVLTNDSGTNIQITEVHGFADAVGQPLQGAYGTLVLNANGTYTYTPDPSNPTLIGLTSTQSVDDIFSYEVSTQGVAGAGNFGILTITVNGVDDMIDASDNSISVTSETDPTRSGNLVIDDDGSGVDILDRPLTQFVFEDQFNNGQNVDGLTRTVDGIDVSFDIDIAPGFDGSGTGNVSFGTNGGHTGFLQNIIRGPGFDQVGATTTITFSEGVVNLSFLLGDIDRGFSSFQDQFTVTGFLNGNEVTFEAQAAGSVVQSGDDTFYGTGSAIPSDATGNVVIVFDGLVDEVVIEYSGGPDEPTTAQLGIISDLSFQLSNSVSVLTVGPAGQPALTVPPAGLTIAGLYGTLNVFPDGTYTYTVDDTNPTVIALGPNDPPLQDIFDYTINDLLMNQSTAQLIVDVNGTNNDPVAVNDGPFNVTEDIARNGTVLPGTAGQDSDPDGDMLSVSEFTVAGVTGTFMAGETATIPNVGMLIIRADGTFTFTPALNYNGAIPTATYTVVDGNGGSDTATLSFNPVSPTPDAPIAVNDGPFNVTEDTPTMGNVLTNGTADSDPDGDMIEVTSFTVAGLGGSFMAGETA